MRRRGGIACGRRDDALGEIVEPLEAAASGDGDEAGVEQVLDRRFPSFPHHFRNAYWDWTEAGGDRPRRATPGGPGYVAPAPTHVLLRILGVHAIPDERVERDRHQARGVPPVFEQLAPVVGERVERVRPIGAEPRERRYIVGAARTFPVDLERAVAASSGGA
jgi:hypothetical protein